MRNILKAAALCILLAGCAPEISSQNARSVTIHHYFASAAETQRLADESCAQHGMIAVAQNDPDNYTNIFECVKK